MNILSSKFLEIGNTLIYYLCDLTFRSIFYDDNTEYYSAGQCVCDGCRHNTLTPYYKCTVQAKINYKAGIMMTADAVQLSTDVIITLDTEKFKR